MLLFSPLLKTTSGQSVSKYRFSSHLLCPWLSALDCLGYFHSFSYVKFEGTLKVFLEPYLFSGGMLVCWLLAALPSCCFFSSLSRVVSGADSVCFLFHMQHQIPVPLWWICSTEVLAPWLLEPIPPTNAVVFVLSMSNFSVGLPSSFYPPPSDWGHSAVSLSLPPPVLPSSIPLSLHPLGLSAPLPSSNNSSQHMYSTTHIQVMLYPPLPCPCCSGGWVLCVGGQSEEVCLISWGSGEQKTRGKGSGDSVGVCVKSSSGEIAWCSTCSCYFSDCLLCSVNCAV